jgi:hypothetical protein
MACPARKTWTMIAATHRIAAHAWSFRHIDLASS